MISAKDLCKTFKVHPAKKGALGSVLSLFSREYRLVEAVKDLSFEIGEGECVGYIGPNGAGKSTTIKMLCGILHPSAGGVTVMGDDPRRRRKRVAAHIGVVFGQRTQLWWDLPLSDSYDILKTMYRVDDARYRRFLQRYDDLLDIGAFLGTPVRKLSLGQRMRADLAAALIHDPPVLFLDEPTIGLDVVAKTRIRRFLGELNRAEKKTILLTTHDMDDIEHLAGRVFVINHGRLILEGTLDDLRRRTGLPSRIHVRYREAPRVAELALAERVEVDGTSVTVHYDRRRTPSPQMLAAVGGWGEPLDIRMEEPEIEDVIQRIY